MNKNKLNREGKKWVEANIISEEQLSNILAMYKKEDRTYLLIILAALLISISMIVFIFSDWAQIPSAFKIVVMLGMMVFFYLYGHHSVSKRQRTNNSSKRNEFIGISFILLGYMLFGTTLFLTLYMYDVTLFSAWPFVVWSVLGLFLYMVSPNPYLFTVALLITIYGQIHSVVNYSAFNYFIFFLFFIGYFHYVFHRGNVVSHYLFTIGLILQLWLLSIIEFEQFYIFSLFLLAVYTLGLILPKKLISERLVQFSIIALLIYKIYETIAVQEDYILQQLKLYPSYFVLMFGLLLFAAILNWITKKDEWITLLLFMPIFYVPHAHIFIIITMFIYSVYLLIVGFQRQENDRVLFGLFAFLLSVMTVIVQYAWETLNKSLFFLIAGIVLFTISLFIERRRRNEQNGGNEK